MSYGQVEVIESSLSPSFSDVTDAHNSRSKINVSKNHVLYMTYTTCTYSTCTYTTCTYSTCTYSTCTYSTCTYSTCTYSTCTYSTCTYTTCTYTTCTCMCMSVRYTGVLVLCCVIL